MQEYIHVLMKDKNITMPFLGTVVAYHRKNFADPAKKTVVASLTRLY